MYSTNSHCLGAWRTGRHRRPLWSYCPALINLASLPEDSDNPENGYTGQRYKARRYH